MNRREVICTSAGLLLATAITTAAKERAIMPSLSDIDTSYQPAGTGTRTGKGVGDFDFLAGEWRIRHLRLLDGGQANWQRFDSGATVHRVLNGRGSVEELRNSDGSDMGMGIRVWLPQQEKWADHWTSAGNGVVNPPQTGEFIDGEGVFISEEVRDGVKWLYRGIWDKITPGSCRWHQSSSTNDGTSWEWNWWMEWNRIA